MVETNMQIAHEINETKDSGEQDISQTGYDIELPQQINPEQQRVLEKLISFLKDMSIEFRTDFWNIVNKHAGTSHELSPRILDFIQKHGFDIPHFRILDKETSEKLIQEMREKQKEKLGFDLYDPTLDDEYARNYDFTVIFALPKQVSQYWRKGNDSEWSAGLDNVGPDIIPWGYYYRKTIAGIRNDIDESNEKGDLYFDRVPGVAHELSHYYIWNVSSQLSEAELREQRDNETHAEQMRSIQSVLAEYLEEKPEE